MRGGVRFAAQVMLLFGINVWGFRHGIVRHGKVPFATTGGFISVGLVVLLLIILVATIVSVKVFSDTPNAEKKLYPFLIGPFFLWWSSKNRIFFPNAAWSNGLDENFGDFAWGVMFYSVPLGLLIFFLPQKLRQHSAEIALVVGLLLIVILETCPMPFDNKPDLWDVPAGFLGVVLYYLAIGRMEVQSLCGGRLSHLLA